MFTLTMTSLFVQFSEYFNHGVRMYYDFSIEARHKNEALLTGLLHVQKNSLIFPWGTSDKKGLVKMKRGSSHNSDSEIIKA